MADDTRDTKPLAVDTALSDMKIENQGSPEDAHEAIIANDRYEHLRRSDDKKRSPSSTPASRKSASHSPMKKESRSQTPSEDEDEDEEDQEIVGGDITVTTEPGKAPRLSRKGTQKIAARPPPLFDDLPDVTEEALNVFHSIKDCIYGSKYMGYSENDDTLDCDCAPAWKNGKNHACGEESDCINRATKMECVDNQCNCGSKCQNQRFQQKQYANVSVIKTEKKGFGLRANTDLNENDFVFEYIGEVINEPTFRRRTIQYDEEGIKHFYFMSLTKSEFVDATKKGGLGRFCNHSCNPNCYVDKWVVGDKLRMGIFAERPIKAGEELVFNYNVDRYGADPQPCYCGEYNCTGFIGGKTQTERATKLSNATIEALGIDDGDGWDTAVAKKPRKKKTGEDDEEYVNNVQPKGLDEDGVRKVMATLMQCKEKWIAVKLLSRLQRCDDDRVRNRVVQMHGYQILRTSLSTWKEDNNVVLQILDILYKFPRLTRNKISDSKIEATIQTLVDSEHEDVAFESKRLLEEWSKLEVAYRIPRKKFDPNAVITYERREPEQRIEEVVKSPQAPIGIPPTGPKNSIPQRSNSFFPPRPPIRRATNALPQGWFSALDQKGNTYYYSKAGATTWHRPFLPAAEPPPPPKKPPKSVQTAKALQDIIDSITKDAKEPSSQTPIRTAPPSDSTPKEPRRPLEKWRTYPIEKQKKLYENTLSTPIIAVMQKYRDKLPRDDLKKFAKEIGKKLVNSDYAHGRVEDPTKIPERQERKVKAYVKEFFDKAVQKKKARDREGARKKSDTTNGSSNLQNGGMNGTAKVETPDASFDLTPTPGTPSTPLVPILSHSPSQSNLYSSFNDTTLSDNKRKREPGEPETPDEDSESNKRVKEDDDSTISPPPPPPPPPVGEMPLESEGEGDVVMDGMVIGGVDEVEGINEETEEQKELRLQEEELMRENEEALRMERGEEERLQDCIRRGEEVGV